ncbi:MAG: hypothetical protein Q9160_000687 [Pyrenula sp. 1 TL-2023]
MAEGIGLAFAVVSAFNNAVQCFEFIQIARQFDKDFRTAILKLDIAKLRLCRWGRAVQLERIQNESKVSSICLSGTKEEQEKAKQLLEQIVELFEDAEKKSNRLQSASPGPQAYVGGDDLDRGAASLHRRLGKLSLKRFGSGDLVKRAKWALHQEKFLNRLIDDVTDLLDGLTELFPASKKGRQTLYEEDGTDLGGDDNVTMLGPILTTYDPELKAAIEKKAKSGQTFHITFAGNNHGLQQGYVFGTQTYNFGMQK